jgi:hypothetical protein
LLRAMEKTAASTHGNRGIAIRSLLTVVCPTVAEADCPRLVDQPGIATKYLPCSKAIHQSIFL